MSEKSWPFHPLLLSLYLPLFLFAHNFTQVTAKEIVLPLLFFLLTGVVVYGAMQFFLRNWQKSAALSSVVLFFLFFYGLVVSEGSKTLFVWLLNWPGIIIFSIVGLSAIILAFFKRKQILAVYLTQKTMLLSVGFVAVVSAIILFLASKELIHSFHAYPLIVWLILALAVAIPVYKAKQYSFANQLLNKVTLFLVIFSILQIAFAAATYNPAIISSENANLISSVDPSQLPDIYYFIPDEYAGKETLQTMYNFDNADFLNFLEEKGFYVTENSVSNYNKTHLSVPSSLNMNFIEDLVDLEELQAGDAILEELAKDNLVVKTLKVNHYTYINVGSRWSLTGKNPNADISYSYEGLSHFNELLVESTILRAKNSPAQVFDFNSLKEIPDIDKSPKFVFAHMPVPHVPFIYDKYGNILPAEDWYDFNNYFGQLLYVNTQLKDIISTILEKSTRPTVIIVQSDHGMRYCDKVTVPKPDCSQVNGYNNLNAYYFSDGDYSTLYETITPVNSFRVVFNKYLETDYVLLEDKSDFTQIQIAHE